MKLGRLIYASAAEVEISNKKLKNFIMYCKTNYATCE